MQLGEDGKITSMVPNEDRKIKIYFNADTAASMMWNFRPQQREIEVNMAA